MLHSHLPYVLNHGIWPHGQDWLNEASAETYIPLIRAFQNLEKQGQKHLATIGISPVLAEQLSSPVFKEGFKAYLSRCQESAEDDKKQFKAQGFEHRAELAVMWGNKFKEISDQFEALGYDLIAEFKRLQDADVIELMTCAATHGYLPLLGTDESVRAQVKLGVQTYEKHFGRKPKGIWLPECAYRPSYKWKHPVGKDQEEWDRVSIEDVLAENELSYFIVDSPLLKGGKATGPYIDRFPALRQIYERSMRGDDDEPDESRKDLTAHLPYRVGTSDPEVACFIRDPETTILVWSGEHGYPGDGNYLEFHKKHFPGGLRYWAVTGTNASLGDKVEYFPKTASDRVRENAGHFKETVRHILTRDTEAMPDAKGTHIIVSPYDTELFGHWWHEGPEFLERMFEYLAMDKEVVSTTLGKHVGSQSELYPVTLPEGSWGEGNHHYIWLNEWTVWTWELIYEAEREFRDLVAERVDKAEGLEKECLIQAGRELLLLESSDWQFLISTWAARDYAEQRVQVHHERFKSMIAMAQKARKGDPLSEGEREFLELLGREDGIFEISLDLWV